MLAIQSVQLGAGAYQAQAGSLGGAYAANTGNAVADRFDVAMAMEALVIGPTLRAAQASLADDGPVYEKMGDDLQAIFGDIPQVYAVYLSAMRSSDVATSSDIAAKILASAGAPAGIRAEAAQTQARNAAIGTKISAQATVLDGTQVGGGGSGSEPTVVYFWNPTLGAADLGYLAARDIPLG
jgi:hypothetical protein